MATVLVLARETPYPPNAGDRVVTHGFVRGLAERGHEVHVVAYGTEDDRERAERLVGSAESAGTTESSGRAESVRLVPRAKSDLPPRLRKLRNYARGRSDVMAMFESPSLFRATRDRIRAVDSDAVLAEHPYIGQAFRDAGVRRAAREADATLVTNAHVVEFAVHRRYRAVAEGVETCAELALETPRLRREELGVYEASDRVLVLGSEDRAELVEAGVSTPVATQHVGLDPEEYEVRTGGDEESQTTHEREATAATTDGGARGSRATDLLFFGSYGWFPNEDAVTAFAAEGFPKIRAARPDARLVVAGRNAPEEVRAVGERPGVEFVGEVPDLASAVRDAAAVVAPLRIGGGTRLKVLESMAWGAPVLTTEAGFEGVDARPGADVAVAGVASADGTAAGVASPDGAGTNGTDARDWDEFAARAVELLDSPERRARLGRNARRRIEQVYALDDVAAELEANLGIDA